MATAKTATQSKPQKATSAPAPAASKGELTTRPAADLVPASALDFAEDAGRGMENADSDTFAIPFLAVLQKGSPQVDEDSGAAIEGAKAGMFFNTGTQGLLDGREKGVLFIPCAFRRVFLRWTPREAANGGFKGEYTPEEVAAMRDKGQIVEVDGRLYAPDAEGNVNPKKQDRFSDTRNHYGLLLDDDGNAQQILLSLTSTQVKKSKSLMTMLSNVRIQRKAPGEGSYTPPTFANVVRIKTIAESNDKGTWAGVTFTIEGRVQSQEQYALAKAFNAQVAKGRVTANYDEGAADGGDSGGTAGGF